MAGDTRVAELLQKALEMGLNLMSYTSDEFIGRNGHGASIQKRKCYWMNGHLFHSGPFTNEEQAIKWLDLYETRQEAPGEHNGRNNHLAS